MAGVTGCPCRSTKPARPGGPPRRRSAVRAPRPPARGSRPSRRPARRPRARHRPRRADGNSRSVPEGQRPVRRGPGREAQHVEVARQARCWKPSSRMCTGGRNRLRRQRPTTPRSGTHGDDERRAGSVASRTARPPHLGVVPRTREPSETTSTSPAISRRTRARTATEPRPAANSSATRRTAGVFPRRPRPVSRCSPRPLEPPSRRSHAGRVARSAARREDRAQRCEPRTRAEGAVTPRAPRGLPRAIEGRRGCARRGRGRGRPRFAGGGSRKSRRIAGASASARGTWTRASSSRKRGDLLEVLHVGTDPRPPAPTPPAPGCCGRLPGTGCRRRRPRSQRRRHGQLAQRIQGRGRPSLPHGRPSARCDTHWNPPLGHRRTSAKRSGGGRQDGAGRGLRSSTRGTPRGHHPSRLPVLPATHTGPREPANTAARSLEREPPTGSASNFRFPETRTRSAGAPMARARSAWGSACIRKRSTSARTGRRKPRIRR